MDHVTLQLPPIRPSATTRIANRLGVRAIELRWALVAIAVGAPVVVSVVFTIAVIASTAGGAPAAVVIAPSRTQEAGPVLATPAPPTPSPRPSAAPEPSRTPERAPVRVTVSPRAPEPAQTLSAPPAPASSTAEPTATVEPTPSASPEPTPSASPTDTPGTSPDELPPPSDVTPQGLPLLHP